MLNIRMSQSQPDQKSLPKPEATNHPNPSPQLSPETQIENQSAEASQAGSTEPDHFDALLNVPEPEPIAGNGDKSHVVTQSVISWEDFHRLFCGGFDAASEFTGLQSLKVSEADRRAMSCTASLYDTMQDVSFLRPLLNPSNKWYGRAFNIGFFFFVVSKAVGQEIAAKQAASPQAAQGEPDIPHYNMRGTA